MKYFQLNFSLFLILFINAILLNNVGIAVLHFIIYYQVTEISVSILEASKYLAAAVVSFFVYILSHLGLAVITIGCIIIAVLNSFLTGKISPTLIGAVFALIKISAYPSIFSNK